MCLVQFKCFINIDSLSWVFYCPHFINEETEAQSWGTCLRSRAVNESNSLTLQSNSRIQTLNNLLYSVPIIRDFEELLSFHNLDTCLSHVTLVESFCSRGHCSKEFNPAHKEVGLCPGLLGGDPHRDDFL